MLSRELKSARVKNGYTQKDLAKELCLGTTSYTKRENGQISFTVDEVCLLREKLSLSDEEIIKIFFKNNVATKATKVS
ncbi:helix-turn-helix domain-containing protein [Tepidibacter formicigenes]|jgi:transcriptional regulator with XRE-family HTH domain|uniref:Helix-turn-helix n=1 Tax=Tepidibacter formicigenes DSM 15518 TaxID=1123349 RepID=A0A1M6SLJ1_9FIRM|nr:helix-turn-helix transcriptional regulator [Tepidibacter formicigenes]SHK45592.1 Helix-turn-helix [Tepidibacter formicigenes DSM 15518]